MTWTTYPVTPDRFGDFADVINRARRVNHCWCLSHRLHAADIERLGGGFREQAMRRPDGLHHGLCRHAVDVRARRCSGHRHHRRRGRRNAAPDSAAGPAVTAYDADPDGRQPVASPSPPAVDLLQLSGAALAALAAGNLAAANRLAPVRLSPYFVGPECRGTWVRRSRQVRADPGAAGWVTRVIWDRDRQLAIGRAGYHGPPDAAGTVEVGYAVDPAYRRRGYARAALLVLLDRASREPAVRTVRATISPTNSASRDLVAQYGFVEVGQQWDDEDGLEIVYEVALPA